MVKNERFFGRFFKKMSKTESINVKFNNMANRQSSLVPSP